MGRGLTGPLAWRPEFAPPVTVLLSVAAAYVVYHYWGSAPFLLRALAGRTRTPEDAQRGAFYLQRALGALLLGAVPATVCVLLLGYDLAALGVNAGRGASSAALVAGVIVVVLPLIALNARNSAHQAMYPQIRARQWDAPLVAASVLTWATYLAGYELCFRGVLIFPLAAAFGAWPAIAVSTAIYVAVHLPKEAGETVGCLVVGMVFGAVAYDSGSVWGPFASHVLIAVSGELLAVRANPQMHFGRAR